MAVLIKQTDEGRQRFRRAIDDKERRRRADRVEAFENNVPLLGHFLRPLANLLLWDEDNRNANTGYSGESRVARMLRSLPAPWYYLNDIVLERAPGEWMQIDHIGVGPHGVTAVETKHWRGAVQGSHDTWRVKANRGWTRVHSSPTQQAIWHANALRRYLSASGFDVPVYPIVVFVGTEWFRESENSCPVFTEVSSLHRHLLTVGRAGDLGPDQCRAIAERIGQAFSLYEASPSALATAHRQSEEKPVGAAVAPPKLATPKQREYVVQLLRAANLRAVDARLTTLTGAEAQAVIDRIRFRRDVPLPEGLVQPVTPDA